MESSSRRYSDESAAASLLPISAAKHSRLGNQAELRYKALADVELCDGLRLLTTANCSPGPWRNQTTTSFHLTA
jgi:hypothetical protein